MKGIAVVSGGLDSTAMIYHMLNDGHELDLVSFDYGQRHKKELQFAAATAKTLGLKHDIVDLSSITHLISNSALTSYGQPASEFKATDKNGLGHTLATDITVPDGHYAEETMKATVVPNRNMIMLSIAAGIAVNRSAEFVATAVHAGDHFIYPDCRPGFIEAVAAAVWVGNEGFGAFNNYPDEAVMAPFMHYTKMEIAFRALELGVPLHMTWSCYKGGENHCGRCGTCVERLEAIHDAFLYWANNQTGAVFRAPRGQVPGQPNQGGLFDATVYDDNEFWRTAAKEQVNG